MKLGQLFMLDLKKRVRARRLPDLTLHRQDTVNIASFVDCRSFSTTLYNAYL